MEGVLYVINSDVSWYFVGGLGAGFDGDVYEIKFGIDEGI